MRFSYRQDPERKCWVVTDRLGRVAPEAYAFEFGAQMATRRLTDRYRRLGEDEKQLVRDYAEALSGYYGSDSAVRAYKQAIETLADFHRGEHMKALAERYNRICYP